MPHTDVDALRAAFDGPIAPTVGVEEEFFVLDPATGDPCWDVPALVDDLADERFKRELPSAQLEHVTRVCRDLGEIRRLIREARADLVARAPGRAFAGSGTHPVAGTVVSVPDDPRYGETLERHPWAAHRQMVAALQVHVAIRPAAVALPVVDALRSYLPELVALAANSPLWAGEATGLHSVRPLVATLLPRQGIPPVLGTWERYAETLAWLAAAGVDDERRIWWEVRLRPEFGTVEMRAMDSQITAADAVGTATVAACLAHWLAERVRDGEPLPVHPAERIAENRWRAVRDGRHARLLDLDTGEEAPAAARLEGLLEQLRPAAVAMGDDGGLDAAQRLLAGNGADRQIAIAGAEGVAEVPRWLGSVFGA